MPSKDAAAEELAQSHFRVEPGIRHIFRVLAPQDREEEQTEPIKLLEVNDYAMSGIVPIFFGPDPAYGLPYPSAIIEVTPEDYLATRDGSLSLPREWRIGKEVMRDLAMANQAFDHCI